MAAAGGLRDWGGSARGGQGCSGRKQEGSARLGDAPAMKTSLPGAQSRERSSGGATVPTSSVGVTGMRCSAGPRSPEETSQRTTYLLLAGFVLRWGGRMAAAQGLGGDGVAAAPQVAAQHASAACERSRSEGARQKREGAAGARERGQTRARRRRRSAARGGRRAARGSARPRTRARRRASPAWGQRRAPPPRACTLCRSTRRSDPPRCRSARCRPAGSSCGWGWGAWAGGSGEGGGRSSLAMVLPRKPPQKRPSAISGAQR